MPGTIYNTLVLCLVPDVAGIVEGYVYVTNGEIFANARAFAVVMSARSVVTWGRADCGGDSSRVQAELKQGVDTIYSTGRAFAAKMQDGSVVTWGMLPMVEIAVPFKLN
jgi:hypothetical protein